MTADHAFPEHEYGVLGPAARAINDQYRLLPEPIDFVPPPWLIAMEERMRVTPASSLAGTAFAGKLDRKPSGPPRPHPAVPTGPARPETRDTMTQNTTGTEKEVQPNFSPSVEQQERQWALGQARILIASGSSSLFGSDKKMPQSAVGDLMDLADYLRYGNEYDEHRAQAMADAEAEDERRFQAAVDVSLVTPLGPTAEELHPALTSAQKARRSELAQELATLSTGLHLTVDYNRLRERPDSEVQTLVNELLDALVRVPAQVITERADRTLDVQGEATSAGLEF